MVVALTGPNHYLLKRRLDELASGFIKEHSELAVEKIDAEETEPQAVLDAVQGLPFLAARKLVIVRNGSANKSLSGQIEQIINSAGDSTDLILYEPDLDKRSAYYKVLKSKSQLEEYSELDTRALAGWVAEEARRLGGEISPAVAGYLVERIGPNQQQLASELDKLIVYEPKITREHVDLLTEKTPQSRVFDLLDAAFGGNKKKALQLYEEQRAQKVEPQAIMAMIAWQLKLLALAKLAGNKSAQKIAADAGVSPWPVQKAQNLARRIDGRQLRAMVAEAADIDHKSKTGRLDLDEALKTYIVTL